jgi:hypothetical protein
VKVATWCSQSHDSAQLRCITPPPVTAGSDLASGTHPVTTCARSPSVVPALSLLVPHAALLTQRAHR